MSINFGANNPSRFPLRARTNRQTNRREYATEHHTHANGYTADVGNKSWTKLYDIATKHG